MCPFFCCFEARSHLGACLEIRANFKCENNATTAFLGGSQIWVNVCIWICFKIRGPKWIQMAKMFVYFLRSRTIHLWRTSCSSLRLKHHPFAKLPNIASCKSRYTVHSITELSWMVHSYPFENVGFHGILNCYVSSADATGKGNFVPHWQGLWCVTCDNSCNYRCAKKKCNANLRVQRSYCKMLFFILWKGELNNCLLEIDCWDSWNILDDGKGPERSQRKEVKAQHLQVLLGYESFFRDLEARPDEWPDSSKPLWCGKGSDLVKVRKDWKKWHVFSEIIYDWRGFGESRFQMSDKNSKELRYAIEWGSCFESRTSWYCEESCWCVFQLCESNNCYIGLSNTWKGGTKSNMVRRKESE